MSQRRYTWIEACQVARIERPILVELISREWVRPAGEQELDEEDVARIRLIQELRLDFGANDEAIPVILHLLDQLYCLRAQVAKLGNGG